MALLRFPTVRDLYDAFPTARDDVGVASSDEECLLLLRSLTMKEAWNSAVSLCAYLLPRREAVWWGCRSLRSMQPQLSRAEAAILDVAEAWVREPDEARRRKVLDLGTRADGRLPATWMALAAGWSSGSLLPPEHIHLRAPPEQTARAVRAGLLIALSQIPSEDLRQAIIPWIESAGKLATKAA
jgi:hypothetical protein